MSETITMPLNPMTPHAVMSAFHRMQDIVGSTRWTMPGIVTTARRWSAAPGTGRGHRGARRRYRSGSAGNGAGATARR